jgi:hypothetical protein
LDWATEESDDEAAEDSEVAEEAAEADDEDEERVEVSGDSEGEGKAAGLTDETVTGNFGAGMLHQQSFSAARGLMVSQGQRFRGSNDHLLPVTGCGSEMNFSAHSRRKDGKSHDLEIETAARTPVWRIACIKASKSTVTARIKRLK